MNIELSPASLAEKPTLKRLLELYLYDFTDFDDADLDDYGLYGYTYLDQYWTEPNRWPFLIRVDDKLAGFALVRRLDATEGGPAYSMAEFFVVRKYRHHGVGRQTARQIFQRFPGRWRVAVWADNQPAQVFWRKVVEDYSQGEFSETWQDDEQWKGPVQTFVSK